MPGSEIASENARRWELRSCKDARKMQRDVDFRLTGNQRDVASA